jgi:large subunit ribosomal protein L25
VPAVIYGNKETSLSVTIGRKELERELNRPGFFTRLMDVKVNGDMHRVLPRDLQLHPVSDIPIHVDFLRYSAERKISVEVPMTFVNEEECPGLKVGGVLNVVRHTIEVLCTADRIPEGFTLDLTGLEIGDSLHASALTLPDQVEFIVTDRDFTVATIVSPTIMVEEEEETPAEDEEGEEGVESEEGAEGTEGAEGEGGEAAEGGGKKDEEKGKSGD